MNGKGTSYQVDAPESLYFTKPIWGWIKTRWGVGLSMLVLAVTLLACVLAFSYCSCHGLEYVAGLLPALLVIQHTLYLINVRVPCVRSELPEGCPQTDSFLDRGAIARQYFLLAIVLGMVGVTLAGACVHLLPATFDLGASGAAPLVSAAVGSAKNVSTAMGANANAASDVTVQRAGRTDDNVGQSRLSSASAYGHVSYLTAFRLGAAGAFVYVLIYLGRRKFSARHYRRRCPLV